MNDEAIYQIRVAGRLGPEWSVRLAGMDFVVDEGPARGTTTVLTGPVPDQAALMGMLEQLYGRGATLLAVERREMADCEPSPGAGGRRKPCRSSSGRSPASEGVALHHPVQPVRPSTPTIT